MGRLVFLSGFALLVAFSAPGLYLRDSGELTAAAFTLGVAHETGFPLFCMLGKLASLVPLGEVATRVGLLSSLCGALAAWAVYRCVRELVGDAAAGVGGAALTLGGLTFWRASAVAEVYAPTAAALAVGLWLLARAEKGSGRAGLALALLGGLSLGLHAQLRLLLGPPAMVFALLKLRKGARWPLYGPLAVAVGAAVVAYLPLRAAANPIANWSNPRTLGGVVRHLAAARIRAAFADQIFGAGVGERLRQFFLQVEGQLGPIVLMLAAGGLWWLLLRRGRLMGAVLALLLVGDALYSAWINPMGLEDLQDGVPTALVLALCAGVGLSAAAQRFPRRGQPFVAGALALMALTPAALSDVDAKLGIGFEADAYSRSALAQAPPRAALHATSDDLLAGAFYLQAVGGLRPDVTLLARQQIANLRARLEKDLAERQVLWEPGADEPPLGPVVMLRADGALGTARDPFARKLFASNLTGLGRFHLFHGEEREAQALFVAAMEARPGDGAAATNLAVVRARHGDLAGALRLCREVLAREPGRQVARLNAARYQLQLADLDGAERDFREYARRAPREAPPLVGLSRVAARRGDRAASERYLLDALERDPHNAEALAWRRELR